MITVAAVPLGNFDPCPRVEVTVSVSGLPVGATVTVWRSAAGVLSAVRGWTGRSVSEADVAVDYEAPTNVPLTYYAAVTSASVVVETSTPTVVTLPHPSADWDRAILQDPLSPGTAILVTLADGMLRSVSRGRRGDMAYPAKARVPIAAAGPLSGLRNVVVGWHVIGVEAHDHVEEALLGPSFLLRTIDPIPLPPAAYLYVQDWDTDVSDFFTPREDRLTTWAGVATQVAPPSVGVVIDVYAWEPEFYDDYAGVTWDDWEALHVGETWLDWQRDPERP